MTKEQVLSIEKEFLKRGELSLSEIKFYLTNNSDKELEKIVRDIENISVLLPRVDKILHHFDISLTKLSIGIGEMMVNDYLIPYHFKFKDNIKVENLNVEKKLLDEYLFLKEHEENKHEENKVVKKALLIMENYFYYLDKFKKDTK